MQLPILLGPECSEALSWDDVVERERGFVVRSGEGDRWICVMRERVRGWGDVVQVSSLLICVILVVAR